MFLLWRKEATAVDQNKLKGRSFRRKNICFVAFFALFNGLICHFGWALKCFVWKGKKREWMEDWKSCSSVARKEKRNEKRKMVTKYGFDTETWPDLFRVYFVVFKKMTRCVWRVKLLPKMMYNSWISFCTARRIHQKLLPVCPLQSPVFS